MGPDAVHPNPDVARRLAHLYKLHRKDMDLRLGDTPYDTLLERLGSPPLNLPPTVHIAGTNGKGSTLAFIRAGLEAAGHSVHVYTSPHLITFNERLRLAGTLIDDDALIRLYDTVLAAANGLQLTFFEFTTAMAFYAFATTPADYVLLETGMGGRLDCTNAILNPALTIITRISLDHTEFLGNTLPEIAAEKAGIIKQNTPCLIAPQADMNVVLPAVQAIAAQKSAPLLLPARDYPLTLPANPALTGQHQHENAAVAVAALSLLGAPEHAKIAALQNATWAGRMERITTGPAADMLPAGAQLWFDGAHNDSAAEALAKQLDIWRANHTVHLIIGLSANKDARAFFETLNGHYDTLTLIDLPRAQKPQTAAHLLAESALPDTTPTAATIPAAIAALAPPANAVIVVAGSLYLYESLFTNS